jgi:hypothetical protein
MLVALITTPDCTGAYGAVNVLYDAYEFSVDTSGSYTVSVLSGTGDTAFYLYDSTFHPGAAADNCIAASNAGNPQTVTEALTAGTRYIVAVIDDTFGQAGDTYTLTIDGPGEVSIGTPDCPYPLPAGSTIYNVPAGAPAFFAADLGSQTNFDLPAGTWYISAFTGDFAKVWIACQASPVYIPSNAVAQ